MLLNYEKNEKITNFQSKKTNCYKNNEGENGCKNNEGENGCKNNKNIAALWPKIYAVKIEIYEYENKDSEFNKAKGVRKLILKELTFGYFEK